VSSVIDGWLEAFEQGFMSYLLARKSTTPSEFADHFHLSDRSANYWLGCLVKSGRVRIASIEGRPGSHAVGVPTLGEVLPERKGRCWPQAVLEVCQESEAA
jgi:hypothetical protein